MKKASSWANAPDTLDLKLVRFVCGVTMTITRASWTKKNDMERIVATRVQMPLALAWALTVHKAQGMSLDRMRVNLSGSFAPPGMACMALSRCRTLAELHVTGLTREKVRVDKDALAFLRYSGGRGAGEAEAAQGRRERTDAAGLHLPVWKRLHVELPHEAHPDFPSQQWGGSDGPL